MNLKDVKIYGYRNENTTRNNTLNSSGQSTVIDFGNNVLIARPLCRENTALQPQDETNRRKDAISLHRRYLPEFTPQTELVILQGEDITTKKPFPVLCRFTPKCENITPITNLTSNQIVRNPYICESMAKISLAQLKIFLTQGKKIDPGRRGTFGHELPPPFAKVANILVTDNIMISTNITGKISVICDPDWYNYVWENRPISSVPKAILKTVGLMTLRTIFFNGLNLYYKTKTKFNNNLISKQAMLD